jgi:hypothetical protein
MATLSDLESAIDALLDHPLGVSQFQLVRRVEEKAYEAYIFGLCLRAVRELGVIPSLRGINGPPNPFVFRGAPGQIYSTARNYGFAVFVVNGNTFEIHAGVEFRGTSRMTHEVDVCIMRSEDATKCRNSPDDPPVASLIAGWECKFYAGTLDKVLGRAFVGLVADVGNNLRLRGLCSNTEHPQLRDYFQASERPYPHFMLTPLMPSNEEIFVNQIKGELKKMCAF